MNSNYLYVALTAVAVFASPGTVRAGGIFVPGVGPQAQARAGAFVAKADDPSALYHNPAGFAKGEGTVIQVGASLLDLKLEFQRAGGYETPVIDDGGDNRYPLVKDQSKPAVGFGGFQAVPIIAVTTDFGLALKRLRFGMGVFAPMGFPERNFGNYDFGDPTVNPPPNRYDVMKQETTAGFPSIGAAYSFSSKQLGGAGELDIGARFSWGFAGLKSQVHTWAVRNYEEDAGLDGLFIVDAKDNFVPTFGAGMLYRPSPMIEVGLSYSAKATIAAKGDSYAVLGAGLPALGGVEEELVPSDDVRCDSGGEIGALRACATIELPQTATGGVRYVFRDGSGVERGDIELDVRWEDWSAHSNYRITVDAQSSLLGLRLRDSIIAHGLNDVFSFRLGGAYSWAIGPGKLVVRAGAAYDTAAADDRWARLDLDSAARTTLAAGLAWEAKNFRVELGGGAVIEPNRTAPACNPDTAAPDCPGFPVNSPSPSPAQPLQGPNNQTISPFNSGSYSSGYALASFGVTTWF